MTTQEAVERQAAQQCMQQELLGVVQSLVDWCDKNPPAGDALYFVRQAREVLARARGQQ